MTYMLKKELTNLFEEMKKRQKAFDLPKQYEEYKEKSDEAEIFYGLWHNTIFLRHNKQRINSALDWKVAREHHEWGIPLVIDFSHTGKYRLDRQRYRSLLCEIRNSAMTNREAKTPFQLHITDVQEDLTPKFMSDLLDKKEVAPFNLTSESHLDMFPRDRLVYLSPDSRNDLVNFNPDDIYVIGGIIDTCKSSPLTLTTAKKLKIRHARFPMRQVVGLQAPLNIDTCLAIMNDLKESNDWFYALRWVPSRYLANRLKGFSDRTAGSAESLLMYRAHRMLSPSKADKEQSLRNHNLNATQYRYYYKKIMECKSKEEMEILLKELEI